MSVSPGNDNSIDAWTSEMLIGIDVLESLEYALRQAKRLGGSAEHCKDIDDALFGFTGLTARAALRVERLKRAENV